MQIRVKVGGAELVFDGRDFKDVIKEAAAFSQGTSCGACNSTNVALDYRVAKGKDNTDKAGQSFTFYAIKCLDCYCKASLGEYQTGGFYLKKWEKFEAQI